MDNGGWPWSFLGSVWGKMIPDVTSDERTSVRIFRTFFSPDASSLWLAGCTLPLHYKYPPFDPYFSFFHLTFLSCTLLPTFPCRTTFLSHLSFLASRQPPQRLLPLPLTSPSAQSLTLWWAERDQCLSLNSARWTNCLCFHDDN